MSMMGCSGLGFFFVSGNLRQVGLVFAQSVANRRHDVESEDDRDIDVGREAHP